MNEGTVYLIHFATPYKHAQHYIGWAKDYKRRIAHHKANTGARLLQVVNAQGIEWSVVRTWQGTKLLERTLKNRGEAARICPICKAQIHSDQPSHQSIQNITLEPV